MENNDKLCVSCDYARMRDDICGIYCTGGFCNKDGSCDHFKQYVSGCGSTEMNTTELIAALDSLNIDIGGVVCFGCEHEDNKCRTHGCAIIHEAAETIEKLAAEKRSVQEDDTSKESADLLLMQNKKEVAK